MVSPKTSRSASRRSVLLASGLGIPPMTLDLSDLHLGRPHRRDRRIVAALARHFVLGDRELVALAGPITSSRRCRLPMSHEIGIPKMP